MFLSSWGYSKFIITRSNNILTSFCYWQQIAQNTFYKDRINFSTRFLFYLSCVTKVDGREIDIFIYQRKHGKFFGILWVPKSIENTRRKKRELVTTRFWPWSQSIFFHSANHSLPCCLCMSNMYTPSCAKKV